MTHYIVGRTNDGRAVYQCDHCKKQDVWGDGWMCFWGGRPDSKWADPEIECVACSPECVLVLRPDDKLPREILERREDRRSCKRVFNDEQVKQIRARLRSGEKQLHIAKELGVSQCLISNIANGKGRFAPV